VTGWPLGIGLITLAVVLQQTGWRYMRRYQHARRQLHTETETDESRALQALVRSSQIPTRFQELVVLATMLAAGIIGAVGLTRF
jgi:hypothetical protein